MADVLYLVRHGEAKSKEEDPDRSLTDQGRKAAEWMATWAESAGLKVDQIRHSGKLRAEQTAAIFAERLRPPGQTVAASGLDPNDDVRPVRDALEQQDRSVMLVGHLPFLGRLAGYLVAGEPIETIVKFESAGLVILRRRAERWTITCVMQPSLTP